MELRACLKRVIYGVARLAPLLIYQPVNCGARLSRALYLTLFRQELRGPTKLRKRFPHTHWGFPMEPDEGAVVNVSPKDKRAKERGIAMITAIMVVSLMFISMADMMINSTVSLEMAIGVRDRIKAEYLAKSGRNLALFVILADLGIDLFQYEKLQKIPSDGPGDIWTFLNGIPIGANNVKLMTASGGLKLSEVNDSRILATLETFDGEFTVTVEDEAAKLNVNYCATNFGKGCRDMLTLLMSCPAEVEFLDKKKWKGSELTANLTDWIDENTSVIEGSKHGNEDDPYGNFEPPRKAKNAPFDSLDELKQVDGWDSDVFAVFSPYLTVYPPRERKEDEAPININSTLMGMMSCLMKDKSEECNKNAVLTMNPLRPQDRLDNVGNLQELKSRLSTVFCENDAAITKNFTYRSDVFNIAVKAEVGDQTRTFSHIIKRGPPTKEDLKNDFKGAYKTLRWKMM